MNSNWTQTLTLAIHNVTLVLSNKLLIYVYVMKNYFWIMAKTEPNL